MSIELDEIELKKLLHGLYERHGYDYTEYALSSIKRRVLHFMQLRKIGSLELLEKKIGKNEIIFEEFVQEISVTVTEMFRDPLFYKSIRENVLRRLATYPVIRIWIAGCATGEEAYSIAILLKEEGLLERSVIYATDINQKSLNKAREGIYGMEHMQSYTRNYMLAGGERAFSEYYTAKYNSVLFEKSLRKNIVFSVHNLSTDRSFNEFQLIICRNVMIYFNQQLQNKVFDLFNKSLCNFGFMALGNKESLLFYDNKKHFEEIDRKEKIYMKIN
ncbi:MAG: cheR [Bacteroidetes bacterium]|nr:cheR [Bacteroidota bacterium]